MTARFTLVAALLAAIDLMAISFGSDTPEGFGDHSRRPVLG